MILAAVTLSVLILVWSLGRVMEALHGNPVFDMTLTYWFGLVVGILLVLWALGSVASALANSANVRRRGLAGLAWGFFLILVVALFLNLEGFRVAAAGLFAVLAGAPDLCGQAIFLLVKFHPFNPMLALNLSAASLTGAGWDIQSLAPYLWHWNALFAFYLWSFACGIALLIRRDHQFAKSLHLCLAAFGLLALIFLKSTSTPIAGQLILFQATAPLLLIFQVLLAYATLRAAAADGQKQAPQTQVTAFSPPAREKTVKIRPIGLPPAAITLALFVFLVLPVMADLQSRFNLSASTVRILDELSLRQPAAGEFVTVAPISIRSGPAAGDDILGVLPEGARIP
ncbi:MAG: hypothetical protein PVI27_12855, partial [Desulfobacteraceae bacterium]